MRPTSIQAALLNGIALSLAFLQPAFATPPGEAERLFEAKIRPVLVERCYKCHSSDTKELKGGLRLDSAAGLRKGGDSGPAIVADRAGDSPILHALNYAGPEMPPDGKLDPVVIADFERWVRMGAPWPHAPDAAPAASAPPQAYDFEKLRQTHWSLAPIGRPEVLLQSKPTAPTAIDAFITARLGKARLTSSPPADRRTLARRAYFDLTGLPPTYEEVELFIADASPSAYAQLIDRLLASPRYGERWGRHWLDIARYSDTKGQVHGKERGFPYAYTYRDYVIQATNDDVPLDQFILEQLAADLLPNTNPQKLAALGFLNLRLATAAPHLQIDDQIDTIGRGLLGLTVACARCHDHKYDAIPTEDYYSLYGVLASSEEPLELPLIAEPQPSAPYAEFQKQLDKLSRERADFEEKCYQSLTEHACTHVPDYLVQIVGARRNQGMEPGYVSLGPEDLKPGLISRWREFLQRVVKPNHPIFGPWHDLVVENPDASASDLERIRARWAETPADRLNPLVRNVLLQAAPKSPVDVARVYGELLANAYRQSLLPGPQPEGFGELLAVLTAEDAPTHIPRRELAKYLQRDNRDKLEKIQDQINRLLVHSTATPPRAMSLSERPTPYAPVVFTRGNPSQPGKPVPRQFLRLLSGPQRSPFIQGSGRLELAQAIVSPDNPLTSRVLVNRVWMHHFGRPLVATPDDFGVRSDPPSHPELLDYLARRLMDGGWSLKRLHREIMLSAAYQQTSSDRPEGRQLDPENRLLWRMNRQRLELEPLRDSLLAVAGRLDGTMFGQPVMLLREPFSRRRTVYGHVDRHELAPLYRTFDFANPYQTTAQRPTTIVPQQTLFMMNAPLAIEQARAVAARSQVVAAADDEARIDALYKLVLSRKAAPAEIEAANGFVHADQSDAKSRMSRWEQLAQVLLMTNEFLFVD
ncbi:MAG: PSD1 and planctomycete cytochrome C domain-containing protein [Planctomycetes bacterium]|nr:PSD1 and planctomycete cytochrome C domain-containing protein [Planctomycetota bacterium]